MNDVSFVNEAIDALVLMILFVGVFSIGTVIHHLITKE
jgi:hypothetical protein